ncbi:MAG TPA: membrane protein insertion efficiency factor YidD [Lentimicrobium sp.]|nr:membrane protein insertion efficiency factor YidD [Lentimicrobium sp.]
MAKSYFALLSGFFINAILFSALSGICQSHMSRSDGNVVASTHPYLNRSIERKESAAIDYIGFYQKYVSALRGQECPMYPSCSNYGLKTFSETNFAQGMVLTSDRLLRCGHDPENYSLTLQPNGFRLIDYPAYDQPPADLVYTKTSYHYAYADTLNDDSTVVFVKKLINNQFYREALLEILRIEQKKDSFDLELFTNKIICLRAIGEYEKALFEYHTKCPEPNESDAGLVYQIALTNYKLGNFDLASKYIALAMNSCNDDFCKSGTLLLSGLICAHQEKWTDAMLAYSALEAIDSYAPAALSNRKILEDALPLRTKSPAVSAILSVVPGAGYAYTGHTQTALSAFLVNGLLAYTTYTSFKTENYGVGILAGVFNLSFYIGNIYGSAQSAKRYNKRQKDTIIRKLEFNTNL